MQIRSHLVPIARQKRATQLRGFWPKTAAAPNDNEGPSVYRATMEIITVASEGAGVGVTSFHGLPMYTYLRARTVRARRGARYTHSGVHGVIIVPVQLKKEA